MKSKLAQTILKNAGFYNAVIDGKFGPKSVEASHKYYSFPSTWNISKIRTGVLQVACIRHNISIGEVDGLWGNMTQSGYERLLKSKDITLKFPKVNPHINVSKRYNNWPKQNYSSMVKFYGRIGENQTLLTLPYKMKLAWDLDVTVSRMSCHEKVHDSLERIFKKTLEHYGQDLISELHLDYFGGCLNVRKMRGGNAWSMHSWGTAVDIDPARNRLKWGRDKAFLARPEYEPFWKIVESEGWTSLGRSRNYDYMHFQSANL
tara:strand:+ start:21433 stop:22215 length:783 start_codon:yes stop_codon:yes gene_type:complete